MQILIKTRVIFSIIRILTLTYNLILLDNPKVRVAFLTILKSKIKKYITILKKKLLNNWK